MDVSKIKTFFPGSGSGAGKPQKKTKQRKQRRRQTMKRNIIVAVILGLIIVAGFSGCTKEAVEAKSMEQIYREEGVPVRTVTVTPGAFETVLSYRAMLSGIEESTAYASMGGKVERVLVDVGDVVKKDQVLVTFPTDSPSASYFQARVAFENAGTSFERINGLYKSGGISLQERDNAKAQYDVAKANWDRVRQMVKVKAPISGYVSKLHVSETDNVDEETALVTISNTGRMKAAIWVSEDEIFDVQKEMRVVATWKGNTISGRVVRVDSAMNVRKKAFRAVVELDNRDNLLKAGTTAEISITTSSRPDALTVEVKDILKEKDKFAVYVVDKGLAKKKNVKLGKRQGLTVEIVAGLNKGDQLVVEGRMLLEDGAKVKVVRGQ